jgi:hypothetical protein
VSRALTVAALTVALVAPPVVAEAHTGSRLHRVAHCESGHNPRTNTGNGHYGAYQFTLSSWRWVGGKGYPHNRTMKYQTRMARRLRDKQTGAKAWPVCWHRSAR